MRETKYVVSQYQIDLLKFSSEAQRDRARKILSRCASVEIVLENGIVASFQGQVRSGNGNWNSHGGYCSGDNSNSVH